MILSSNGQAIDAVDAPASTRGVIYAAVHRQSGRMYIGRTVMAFSRRKNAHLQRARKGDPNHLYRAIRQYGESAFVWVILSINSEDHLAREEARLIAHFGSYGRHGFNQTPGGEISPFEVPEISARVDALRPRIAEKNRGRVASADTRARIASALRGKPHTEERRRKNSEGQRGRKLSAEQIEKIRKGVTGRKFSSEHRRKIAAAKSRYWAGMQKERTHCKNGHELNEGTTVRVGNKLVCVACRKATIARYKARKKHSQSDGAVA